MKTNKNYAFIDSQNLNIGIQRQGWKLDFGRLRKYLSEKYKIQKAFLFIGYLPENEALYTNLKNQGYTLVFKPTLVLPDGKVKGNVDGEMVLHTMIEFPNYHKAIIMSSDGDFHCLAEHLAQKNKLLKLMVPNKKQYSSLLKKFNAYLAPMNGLKELLQNKKRQNNNKNSSCQFSSTTRSLAKKKRSTPPNLSMFGSTAVAPRCITTPTLAI